MARLIVHVEGVTEEEFVHALLAPHLLQIGWQQVSATRMGRARSRARRHGIKGWDVAKVGIIRHLRQDRGCYVSTLVDYYGLPREGSRAWPGRAATAGLAASVRGTTVQQAMLADLSHELGGDYEARRFVPFVVMHEFEALLFSDCAAFARGIGEEALAPAFQAIRDQFPTPEDIDDSPQTAPSKRVEALYPGYQKPLLGGLAALEIGLERMRRACPHFHAWLTTLESLV